MDKLVKNKEEGKEWVNIAKKELFADVAGFSKDLVTRITSEIITEKQ